MRAFSVSMPKDTNGSKDTIDHSSKSEVGTPSGDSKQVSQSMEGSALQKKVLKVTHVTNKKRSQKATEKAADNDYKPSGKASDDVSESQDRKRKKHKTTEYFYLLERKALRMMRRYYKESFEEYASKYKYKQTLKKLDRSTVDQYFKEYVLVEFANNSSTLKAIGADNLINALQVIILCDSYNKNERVTDGMDFDEIRNLLNKYNSKNLNSFFKTHAHSFLYSHYFRLSAANDVTNQGHVDQDKLKKQMESLFERSLDFLPDLIKSTVTQHTY